MATEPATEKPPCGARRPGRRRPSASTSRASGRGGSALRRLRRNKVAIFFGIVFVLLVAMCLAAPALGQRGGQDRPEREPPDRHDRRSTARRRTWWPSNGVPIGPTWQGEFFLGADTNGRDVMVRLLYGGRNSLVIGLAAAFMTTLLSIVLGLVAGFFRGKTDTVIRAVLDVMWSFPVVILGVALGVALALGGLKLGPITISGDSLLDTDLRDRARVHPLHGPAGARAGALAAREGVRGGRARPGGGPAANHVPRGAAQPHLHDPGLLHPADRQRDPARGGAVVPRRGRAAPESVLGHDDRRGRRPHRHRPAPGRSCRA